MEQRLSLVLCVHYNSPSSLEKLLRSLPSQDEVSDLRIVIVDNSEVPLTQNLSVEDHRVTILKPSTNLGYFGGAAWGLRQLEISAEWVIVCNADVCFADDFFPVLRQSKVAAETAVIAPSIVSGNGGIQDNPYLERPPSVLALLAYSLLFRSAWLYALYEWLSGLKRRRKGRKRAVLAAAVERDIYAPHGACMVFTRNYFAHGGTLEYPGFLYGEETFVAVSVRSLGLRVRYTPSLNITHQHQVSTGRLPNAKKVVYLRHAADFALRQARIRAK